MVNNMDKILLHKIALTYINTDVTMQVLADHYKVSKPTIVRALSGTQTIRLNSTLQKLVDETKKNRWLEAKTTKGNLGHKKISGEQAKILAIQMVEDGLSLKDLVVEDGPSVGTIYSSFTEENLGKELYEKVTEQYAINKKGKNSPNNKKGK